MQVSSDGLLHSWLTYASAATATVSIVLTVWYNGRSALRSIRPVLVMLYHEDGWHIQNVGNGPALDVVFARNRRDGTWYDPVRLPPLAKDAEHPLHWTEHDDENSFGACYSDVEGRRYTSVCRNDVNHIMQGRKLPHWNDDEIRRFWKSQPDSSTNQTP